MNSNKIEEDFFLDKSDIADVNLIIQMMRKYFG